MVAHGAVVECGTFSFRPGSTVTVGVVEEEVVAVVWLAVVMLAAAMMSLVGWRVRRGEVTASS